jgi:hypothetical protein
MGTFRELSRQGVVTRTELGVGGWAGGRGMGWGQNLSGQVLLYPTHSFPLACLIFSPHGSTSRAPVVALNKKPH